MTTVELFPMDVGTFRLKRRWRTSVPAGGHLPQCKRVGGDFEREEAYVLQNSCNSNRICGLHHLSAATGGWGYFDFNHFEPKAPTAKVRAKSECAFCHIAGAKKDQVWTQFYRLLDK
jgi:hypothetical protein